MTSRTAPAYCDGVTDEALDPARDLRPQTEWRGPAPLLGPRGELRTPGWGRRPWLRAEDPRTARRAPRRTAWDFFTVFDDRLVLNLNLSDLGRFRTMTIDVLELETGRSFVNVRPLRADQLSLSREPRQPAHGATGRSRIAFDLGGGRDGRDGAGGRDGGSLVFEMPGFGPIPTLSGEVRLAWPREDEVLACAFPLSSGGVEHFYEVKAPGIAAEGTLHIGRREHRFEAGRSFAVMDWARAHWPKRNFWRWGALMGEASGRRVALNLGHGFGDTRAGTENALFVDGVLHKLGEVRWRLDRTRYAAPWTLESPDAKTSLAFRPVRVANAGVELGLFGIRVVRVFGEASGILGVPGQAPFRVDGLRGFCEEAWIHW